MLPIFLFEWKNRGHAGSYPTTHALLLSPRHIQNTWLFARQGMFCLTGLATIYLTAPLKHLHRAYRDLMLWFALAHKQFRYIRLPKIVLYYIISSLFHYIFISLLGI